MLKTLVWICLFLSFQAQALEREVVILTSLKESAQNSHQSKEIEKRFQHYFKNTNHRLVIKHQVGMQTLEDHLLSPKTLAIFWISHATGGARLGQGFSLGSRIQDYYGNDIKSLFKRVNPNIRFLSLIGCQARPILKKFQDKGFYSQGNLMTHSFKRKVSLNTGIRRAIKASAELFDNSPNTFMTRIQNLGRRQRGLRSLRTQLTGNPSLNFLSEKEILKRKGRKGVTIEVVNTNPNFPAILTVGDHYLGVLKKGHKTQSFTIPHEAYEYEKYKLMVTYDERVKEQKVSLNALKIYPPKSLDVEALRRPNGDLYGRQTNFYYLKK